MVVLTVPRATYLLLPRNTANNVSPIQALHSPPPIKSKSMVEKSTTKDPTTLGGLKSLQQSKQSDFPVPFQKELANYV